MDTIRPTETAGAGAGRALQVTGRGLDLIMKMKAVEGFKAGKTT